MDRVLLSKHIKKGDTLYTPFTDPTGIGATLKISSWSRDSLPDFLWLGMIIHHYGRDNGLKKIYSITNRLNAFGICIPEFASITELSNEKKTLFWNTVTDVIQKKALSPLALIITPDIDDIFYNYFFDSVSDIDRDFKAMFDVIKECDGFHDELTTDICFSVVWFYIVSGKLNFSSKTDGMIQALTDYHKHNHDDPIMRTYRPAIRSCCQAMRTIEGHKDFAKFLWERLGQNSECNTLQVAWTGERDMTFFDRTLKVIDYISSTNEDKKMDTKYNVIMGIVCYIVKIYAEIEHKDLCNDVSGRILFRSMLEAYINLKYLIMQESEIPDVFERFKAYGLGKYKLIMAKLREGKYQIDDSTELCQDYMELLVNEEMDESFINMSFGYFDRTTISKKFSVCNEQDLYEIYYEYGTNFTHAFWGAIRESSMLLCDNPAHDYHTVPDYKLEQNLKSVHYDCEMLMRKVFSLISDYIELPEFYTTMG